jgi:hypothetical protein
MTCQALDFLLPDRDLLKVAQRWRLYTQVEEFNS